MSKMVDQSPNSKEFARRVVGPVVAKLVFAGGVLATAAWIAFLIWVALKLVGLIAS